MPGPGVPGRSVPPRHSPVARPFACAVPGVDHPPIELFLDELPSIDSFLDELPLIEEYVAEDREQDEGGWAIADWQKYDWGALAALGPYS